MSDVKKCDRCGIVYEKTSKSRVINEYFHAGIDTTKNGGDVCPKCAVKFDKWWNKKRKAVGE